MTIDMPGERGMALYFAGRKPELSELHRRLRSSSTPPGLVEGLALITGIPGIGKTQLGLEFARQARQDWQSVVFDVGTDRFEDATTLFLDIGGALGARREFEEVAGVAPEVTAINAKIAGTGGGMARDVPRRNAGLESMLANSSELPVWRHTTLVVIVDELHNITAAATANLRVLHEGKHGCPILPIGIGLPHTQRALSAGGISRCEGFTLGFLSDDESRQAIARGLEALNVTTAPPQAVAALAKGAMNFPQHINGHIRAAAEVVAERGDLKSGRNVREALNRGTAARVAYYNMRLRAMDDSSLLLPLVGHMIDTGVDVVPRARAVAVLGADSRALLEDAMRHGVLIQDELGSVSFGIPSFGSYLKQRLKA